MTVDRLSRRNFLYGAGGLSAAVLLTPEALAGRRGRVRPTLRGGRFAEGVLSGDPTPRGITLWTRLSDVEGTGTVEVQVARDRGFRKVVARELVKTTDGGRHYAKARVTGLDPYEQYYYRFATRDEASPVGRFRTALPPDSRQPVRFAFFSCQDFTFGYYNAHALLAEEDVDFVVNLGDYIYAEAYYGAGVNGGVRNDPIGESISLDQYRAKYALYRSDPKLRRVHARFPMISIWDDHEVVDNYAGGAGPTGGLDPENRYSLARKRAGYQAYFESMPTFGASLERRRGDRIYRGLRFGRNMDLLLLDQRQYRDDQPCGDPTVADPADCPDLPRRRDFLGRTQMKWAKKRLDRSPAAWKVVANQLMVQRLLFTKTTYFILDSWQGYPTERNELLGHIKRRKIEDVVFVTGDIHTFFAGDVKARDSDRRPVATEFVGGAISSRGISAAGGGPLPDALTPGITAANRGWLAAADYIHAGYGIARASRGSFRCSFRRVESVKTPRSRALPTGRYRWRLGRGEPSLLD